MKTLIKLLLLVWVSWVQADSAGLRVHVDALRNSDGMVNALVFNDQAGYPSDVSRALRHASSPITDGAVEFEFQDLPAGQFVVTIVHDENNNGKLDRHWYGKPVEGVGVSNNVHSVFGPPDYEKCLVPVTSGVKQIDIAVVYP